MTDVLTEPRVEISFDEFYAKYFLPKQQKLQAQDAQWRDEAFVAGPITVCGLPLRGMTPYDLGILHGLENPFVVGGQVTPERVAQFLAVLVDPPPRGWWRRRKFIRHVAAYSFASSIREIRDYVKRMFYASDVAFVEPGDKPSNQGSRPEPLSIVSSVVMSLASHTGWSETEILQMRLARVFQYRKAIAERQAGAPSFSYSDKVVSEALEAHGRYMATGELPTI
ncbi:hypothetical protein [Oleiharenicola lentus]|uniref:hypothetical protein n=1 Tax=Oleiharenicola lentus TaxID=2508720 RepID=UPI003F671307